MSARCFVGWPGSQLIVIGMLFFCAATASAVDVSSAKTPKTKPKTWEERDREFKNKSVDELVAMLKANPTQFRVIHRLRKLKDPKATGPLQDAFQVVKEKNKKQAIAAALVSLGVKDDSYWNYLEGFAKQTVEADVPFPISGKERSPEFVEWCKKRGLDPEKTAGDVMTAQSDILLLGLADDKRAIPLLLQGLKAKNPLVVDAAAMGLARVGYKPAIPQIVDAAKRQSPDMIGHTALYLLLFNDAAAQSAADELITDNKSIAFVRAMSPEKQHEFILGE